MTQGTVVLAGSLPVEHLALDLLVGEFGWSLNQASSLRSLAELNADYNVVAVLFSLRSLALPWEQALRGILELHRKRFRSSAMGLRRDRLAASG